MLPCIGPGAKSLALTGDSMGWMEEAESLGKEVCQQQDLLGLQKLFLEGLGLPTDGSGDSFTELQDQRPEGEALKVRSQGYLYTPARPSSCLGASEPWSTEA